MKTALSLLCLSGLVCLSASAQVSPLTGSTTATVDKVKLENYLRRLEAWPAIINVKIDDPKASDAIPGYFTIAVHLSYNDQKLDQSYYISRDGQKVLKAEVFDVNKSPFQANLDKIKTEKQPAFGAPEGAPVNLVVFGDFECPYCKEESTVLRQQVPSTFPGKVRVYFMDFPLESIHPWARQASLAGRCIYKQGEASFWKYHDWIYEHQMEVTVDNYSSKLNEWAPTAGLDAVALARCVDGKATAGEVDRTEAMGHDLGVDGTPTLYLNGRKLMDQYAQWSTLQQLIALEIDQQAKLKEEEEKCCTLPSPSILKK